LVRRDETPHDVKLARLQKLQADINPKSPESAKTWMDTARRGAAHSGGGCIQALSHKADGTSYTLRVEVSGTRGMHFSA
jgi:hypothetical protein